MILFNVMSLQFMADNDTINLKEHTITIRHNIKLLHLTITHYPEKTYKIKKANDIVYNWTKFLKFWIKHLPEYSNALHIEFDTLVLDVDYSLAPIYSSNDNIYIGIYIFNTTIIKNMNTTHSINSIINTEDTQHTHQNLEKLNKKINYSKKSYSFLSSIEPYVTSSLSNINNPTKTNKKTKTITTSTITTNKYNFMYGILNNNKNSTYDTFKNKEFSLDTNITIPINYILQNSMNYLPKLDINRIKMNSQNLLSP
jgi:hypothetical protein